MPKSNQEYWNEKLNRNIKRGAEVNLYYLNKGWKVIRLWEHEFKQDFNGAINFIADLILEARVSK